MSRIQPQAADPKGAESWSMVFDNGQDLCFIGNR